MTILTTTMSAVRRLFTGVLLVAAITWPAGAQEVAERVRAWRGQNEPAIVREFTELLAIPNVASDTAHIRRNADWIAAALRKRGVESRLLELDGAPPVVFGELKTPGATRTVIFYAHYDGQPVDRSQWASDPWAPVLRSASIERGGRDVPLASLPPTLNPEWRLYARSSGDDKAPVMAILAALDALRAANIRPSVNLKFFFEGEEEAGSPHLRGFLERYRDLLKADGWLFCDGPVHQTRRPQLYFGVRGIIGVEMTLYGPARALHSGHYGNWAPNPAALLAHLIASMRDREGNITVAGIQQAARPLGEAEKRAVAEAPPVEQQLKQEQQLAWSESESLAEAIARPALNVRGLRAGSVGETAANAIPTEARASLDIRLVPDVTPVLVREKLEAHIRQQGFHVVHQAPDAETRARHPRIVRLDWETGYPAVRTAMDSPFARDVARVVERAAAGRGPVVKMPTLGGSLPLYVFVDVLGAPLVGLPIANHDNSQHAANENLRLQNLWDGIEVFAALIAEF